MATNPLLVGNNTWRSALTGGTGSWVGLPTPAGATATMGGGTGNPPGALGALPALGSGTVKPSGFGGGPPLKASGRSPGSQSPLAAALAGY
jgi:hypothetical protein